MAPARAEPVDTMKTALLLGLLMAATLLVPAADAHFIYEYEDPLTRECLRIEIPGPHGAGGSGRCEPVHPWTLA